MGTALNLLREKSTSLATLGPEETALHAARLMNDQAIGSVLVLNDAGQLVGIFTERDVLRRIVSEQRDPATTKLKDVMTTPVAVATPATTLNEIRRVMREKRIRHLPVVENERAIGMVSIGDLNRAEHDDQERTIHYLEQYMSVL